MPLGVELMERVCVGNETYDEEDLKHAIVDTFRRGLQLSVETDALGEKLDNRTPRLNNTQAFAVHVAMFKLWLLFSRRNGSLG